jgi:hypothetical protein
MESKIKHMKKLLVIMFALGVFLIMASMFVKHTEVEPQQKSLIENSDLGFSAIPEDNGI